MVSSATQVQCKNCGEPLELAFCPRCGQSANVDVPTVQHFLQDAASAIFTYDSKFWRTIKLLATRPGELSVAYVEGRRASFVNPVPLYVWLQAICFLAFRFGLPKLAGEADARARSLLLMAIILSVFGAIYNVTKKRKFGEHLVFALHLSSYLLFILTVIYSLTPLAVWILAHVQMRGKTADIGPYLTLTAEVFMVPYTILAIKRFYRDGWLASLVKTAALYYSYFYVLGQLFLAFGLH